MKEWSLLKVIRRGGAKLGGQVRIFLVGWGILFKVFRMNKYKLIRN